MASDEGVRLDRWLWAARIFKTRALAQEAVDGGRVRVNGDRAKRARPIRVGDEVRIRRGPYEYRLTVRQLAERRGSAQVAATLYVEDSMSKHARERLVEQVKATPTAVHQGKGRPTKRQRRDIDRFKRGLAVAFLLATPAALGAQAPDPATPLPVDTLITVDTLPNGLRYYVRENARPEQRAELRLVVRAGSVLEDDDQLGLAHFTEHMAFNGTEHFAKQDLVNYFELVGMQMGPHLNAYTSFDETVYMLRVPTDSADILRTAFQVLEDWAHALSFDPEEIDKERGVVIEEWRLGRGANQRMLDEQLPIAFRGSRYAERLPIGTRESLLGFDPDAARRFYRDWYRPDLMAVIAVGDFDGAVVEGLIREHFGRLAARPSPRERPMYAVPDNREPLYAIATDPEATGSSVGVLFKQPLRDHSTVGAYRRDIVERLFSSMLNLRFYELSQEADPPFLGAGAGQGRFIGAGEVFSLNAGVPPGGIERGLDALLTEAERVARFGFTDTEFDRAKTRLLRGLERAYEERERSNSGNYAAEFIRNFLEGEPIPGIARELELHRRFLPAITLAEVNRLVGEWITPGNRVILVNAPDKEGVPVPTEPDLQAVFTRVAAADVEPYADEVTDVPLVAERPAGARIVTDSTIPEVEATVWQLANGVRVVLKPTDFQADQVLFGAFSPGGNSVADDGQYFSAANATGIVNASGVGPFSAVDLQKYLTGKVVAVRPYIGPLEEGFSGSASPRDLETLFQLVYAFFQTPRRDSAAVQSYLTRMRSFVESRGASPEQVFFDTLQVTLTQHHRRARPLTPELLAEFEATTAYAFYEDRFRDASDFTFVFVGNIDLDVMRPLVQTWLGGLPSIRRRETWRDTHMDPPTGVVERTVRRGVEPKSRTQIVYSGPFAFSRRDQHDLGALASALEIRLREVLREDLGGTYSVSVNGGASIRPDTTYRLSIAFGADPERLEDLVATVFAEIERFKQAGPTDSTVLKVQEAERRGRETAVRQNRYWVNALEDVFQGDRSVSDIVHADLLTDGLTRDRLREMARRYLRTDNYVRVSLYPEPGRP